MGTCDQRGWRPPDIFWHAFVVQQSKGHDNNKYNYHDQPSQGGLILPRLGANQETKTIAWGRGDLLCACSLGSVVWEVVVKYYNPWRDGGITGEEKTCA